MGSIDWLHFNWIDYAIIGIILLSLLIGVVRGFVCEVISVITWVAAFVLAFKFAGPLAAHMTFTDSPTTSYVLAFIAIVILTLVIGITVNVLVRHVWHQTGVPVIDRILGLLLGIVRGVAIIAFVLLFIDASPLKEESTVKAAQLIPLFNPAVKWLRQVLPAKIVDLTAWAKKKEPAPISNTDTTTQNSNNPTTSF